MKIGDEISVTITQGEHKGKTLVLDVEDFQPYEPSNYCHSAGWNCAVEIRGESVWFFVDESGVVWDYNDEVGLCPAQEREARKRDAWEAKHHDA
jgi:hypothetical protein